jgi:hypothetical protein
MYGVITTVPAPVEMYDEIPGGSARPSTACLCTSGGRQPTASRRWKSGSQRSTTTAPTPTLSFP